MIRRALVFLVLSSAALGACGTAHAQGARRQCLTQSETLESIGEKRLVRPSDALAQAAVQASAEAVGARLCRWDDSFIYEITLLRSDGRVLRVYVDAASGRKVDNPAN